MVVASRMMGPLCRLRVQACLGYVVMPANPCVRAHTHTCRGVPANRGVEQLDVSEWTLDPHAGHQPGALLASCVLSASFLHLRVLISSSQHGDNTWIS